MRIAQILGTVTLSRAHPSFRGARLKLAAPLSLHDLRTGQPPAADTLVVYDELGADIGDRVMLSEGPEAARPFYPDLKPVDAYNAGLLDHIDFEHQAR
jgi:microcompartment protein CcmK/EutM